KAYDNLLRLSVPPSVAAGHASHVYRLSQESDPVEHGRWKCIFEVVEVIESIENIADLTDFADLVDLASDPARSSGSRWSISHADGIVAVERTAGGAIEIR